jgi:hypothetical protein
MKGEPWGREREARAAWGVAPAASPKTVKWVAVALLATACNGGRGRQGWDPDPAPPSDLPQVAEIRPARETPHPRILFVAPRVARLVASAKAATPLWKKLERRCQIFSDSDQSAGYLGLQWGEAIGDLTTCFYATGEERYRERAMFYLRALLHDKQRVGDGQGGDAIVRGNSGYPIRSFGLYAALAFDWLHDAPGMEELRPVIQHRLGAWLDWYGKQGYLNDSPYSNYFWGYFATLAMAGIATDGEVPEAAAWQERTRALLDKKVVPGFQARLKGGEWTEGWQYGELVAMEVALLVDAYRTATGADYSRSFSWLGEIVDAFVHRTHPDRASWYGNGTQHKRPPPPDGMALAGALLVLEQSDRRAAERARFIVRELFPPLGNERIWFAVVADDAAGAAVDPRDPGRLSYHLAGPGQTFLRSGWGEDAVWVSFQAGPRVAVDHEHNDQGHFEIWRGGDALVGDFGTQEAYATINHNSLLVDDGKQVLNYPPNQGVWGRKSRTVGWSDRGDVAVVVGDLADAWAPKCVERGCSERSVVRAVRTLVYLRPDAVVIDDDLELSKGEYGATWAAHVRSAPEIKGPRASVVVGRSRLDVTAVAGGALRAVSEPTTQDDHIYRANRPDGAVWRLEIESAKGKPLRRIRTWLRAAASGAAPAEASAVSGQGIEGAVGPVGQARVAVLFAAPAGGTIALPPAVAGALVAGLEPGGAYTARAAPAGGGCTLSVARGGSSTADPSGSLAVDLAPCRK